MLFGTADFSGRYEATGVREQMTQRHPVWRVRESEWRVEADDALFDTDHHGPRNHRFGERRQAIDALGVADRLVTGDRDDGRGHVLHGPRRDQMERLHDASTQSRPVRMSSAVRNAKSSDWRPLSRGSHIVS